MSIVLYIDVLILVNIHTHLHASILFAFLLCTFTNSYFKAYEDISWTDRAVFAAFLSSAVFCLLCSAFYHMASSHSKQVSVFQPTMRNVLDALTNRLKVAARCNALDYSGIIGKPFSIPCSRYHHDFAPALILGSFYPCVYYGFYCEQHYRIGYVLLITLAGLGAWPGFSYVRNYNFLLAAAYIVLNPEYAKPTHRHARTRVFIALGLSSVLPVSHLVFSHGIYILFREMGFLWLLAAGVMYITGAVL